MNNIYRPSWIIVILSILLIFGPPSAWAGTVYYGNSLTSLAVQGGGPDTIPPFVILGEYSTNGPLPSSVVTLPVSGTVQDVKFYGQNYTNFTLYALTYV